MNIMMEFAIYKVRTLSVNGVPLGPVLNGLWCIKLECLGTLSPHY